MSLQRRQANELFLRPSTQSDDIRFWTHPEIALQSWLAHNQAIVKHMKLHPERCVLLSQEAQIAGTRASDLITPKLPLTTQRNVTTGVDMSKTQTQKRIRIHHIVLRQELEATWQALQTLSSAPADNIPVVEWGTASLDLDAKALGDAKHRLHTRWDSLGIQAA